MTSLKTEKSNDGESVIILAAGSSSRLGQSKQLVEVNGMPLLLKSTRAALDAGYAHVIVVLGAHADLHKKTIAHLPAEIITHPEWEKGMGSSLKAGLNYMLSVRPETKTVVVMVCDQPLLTPAHLSALRVKHSQGDSTIVASRYGNTLGVPSLFDRTVFQELLSIKDTQGAKVVIESHSTVVSSIDWEAGLLDIDTPEDLKRLNARQR